MKRLAFARDRADNCKLEISRQKIFIAGLVARGLSTDAAEDNLHTLETSQAFHVDTAFLVAEELATALDKTAEHVADPNLLEDAASPEK